MKVIFLTILLCISANAQLTYEFEDACGQRGRESDFAILLGGKVTKIIDGNTIWVEVENKKRIVDLAAINVSRNRTEAKNLLVSKILNQKVELLVSTSDFEKKKFYAVVESAGKDINRMLIEGGIAFYQKPKPYSLLNYNDCVYRQVEKKAKESKLGIWAK